TPPPHDPAARRAPLTPLERPPAAPWIEPCSGSTPMHRHDRQPSVRSHLIPTAPTDPVAPAAASPAAGARACRLRPRSPTIEAAAAGAHRDPVAAREDDR